MTRKQSIRGGEKRTERIYIRVSPEEKERIRLIAREQNATVSCVVTDLFYRAYEQHELDDKERKSPTVLELEKIRSQIWRIGHNINQIARLTNTELGASHEDVAVIRSQVDRCDRIVAGIDRIISSAQEAVKNGQGSRARI